MNILNLKVILLFCGDVLVLFFLTLTLMDSEKFWFNSKFNFDLGCLCSSRYISSNFDCDLMLLFISKRGIVVIIKHLVIKKKIEVSNFIVHNSTV